jgi:phenylalanyl-tRNA synthetase beta chain
MKIPFTWLKDYVDIDVSPEALAEKLLAAGFETEQILRLDKGIRGIVAGKILSVEKHGNAAKLQVCTVDIGRKAPVTICTAATNVFAGAFVPAATDGAVLADGTEIRSTDMRGVQSCGMLCSGAELGIDDGVYEGAEIDGIMIFREEYAPGTDVRAILGLDETVLDIAVTANRPDCQSVYGIAREAAAVLGKPLKPLPADIKPEEGGGDIAVTVENPELCTRYMAGEIRNIRLAPAPERMRRRLIAAGIRPVNNIVDITNYVLIEAGQPLHAFDAALLAGGKITVRNARTGESITALNGKDYALNTDILAICDAEKPVAIAGVMGGRDSGINGGTVNAVLEAARFNRGSVRGTGRALSLRSDSSARFEKGVDSHTTETGFFRALHLVQELQCGTVMSRFIDIGEKPERRVLSFPLSAITDLLGIAVPAAKVVKILNGLSIKSSVKGKLLTAEPPPCRVDLENEADIAEEVIRVYGYDKLESRFLAEARPTAGGVPFAARCADRARDILTGLNLNEAVTYSFIPTSSNDKLSLAAGDALCSHIRIRNPLSEEYAVMRANLAHNLLTAADYNLKRKNKDVRLFEYGRVYRMTEGKPWETNKIAVLLVGADADFFTLKGIIAALVSGFSRKAEYVRGGTPFLHPGKRADIVIDGVTAGFLGEVHPVTARAYDLPPDGGVYLAEVDFDILTAGYTGKRTVRGLPKFPAVERDLALVLTEEAELGTLIGRLKAANPLVEDVTLFDLYRGDQIEKGYKSAALRITLQDYEDTLTDTRINAAVRELLDIAAAEFGARIRA